MSIVQKFKSFWFGPADNYEREDFEDLFETSDDVYATNGQLALDAAPAESVMPVRQPQVSMGPSISGGAKVLEHPNAQPMSEVLVIEPRQFEESVDIVEHLRGRKSVLLNLHMLDNEQSQRIVDFLSGACWAIDGHQQRIGDGVFLFAPASVTISSESTSSKAIKDAFWNKTQTI
ncbi:MAG TPA: cell division protein SepF [Candidatus Obscuribacter sp.]|nr:cell division protein SepF [Candidatus Melainabacteria bacterium]MBK8220857.1 cell division protein SepF [Candidatus Obscuribacter sp.]MBK9279450.1 cell division protein SepF [Candidatus Obscuribacter sp.]MBL8081473.1 cell division protein SepF [Candidatus Obscuribacter sp.]MDX1988968.1 cell division protein SepF [Candidatus Obscuribacter sp.]